jgi:hypothetical protein
MEQLKLAATAPLLVPIAHFSGLVALNDEEQKRFKTLVYAAHIISIFLIANSD